MMKTPLILLVVACGAFAAPGSNWWPASVDASLARAGENRKELEKALGEVPEGRREAMAFLIANMPEADVRSLKADYLLRNVAQASEAFDAAPWAKEVPRDVFLNDVLPYASLNERRDDWRGRIHEIAAPIVKDCKTPGEAAHALNRRLFKAVNVKYSTQRKKPDQSGLESIESGLATCSGLSILLVSACRAVGVPARVAGTPMWTNMRGNHTWVEVWDGGWHFAGAAEPDKNGLDRGWFAGDASKAKRDVPVHAIYASSFRKTGVAFPLVWNSGIDWVPAVNVTERYTVAAAPGSGEKVRLLVRVLDRGARVAAKVTVTDPADAALKLEGTSRDESADLNNILHFQLRRDRAFKISVERDGRLVERAVKTVGGKDPEQTVDVVFE
jgi:transglutaminase-like putative cysteine protease